MVFTTLYFCTCSGKDRQKFTFCAILSMREYSLSCLVFLVAEPQHRNCTPVFLRFHLSSPSTKKSGLVCSRSLWYNLLIEIGIPVRSHHVSQMLPVIIFIDMYTEDSFCAQAFHVFAYRLFSCNICLRGGCFEQRYEQR